MSRMPSDSEWYRKEMGNLEKMSPEQRAAHETLIKFNIFFVKIHYNIL